MVEEGRKQRILDEANKLSAQRFSEQAQEAFKEKKDYLDKLESATGEDVFKYLLLINVKDLEGYVSLTRAQAEQSFELSKSVALAGFSIIGIGIVLGVLSSFFKVTDIKVAYLASVAGILSEFVSGVFFYLYNRTLQQLNIFHDKLAASQQMAMSLLTSGCISDDIKRDDSKAGLSQLLMSRVLEEDLA